MLGKLNWGHWCACICEWSSSNSSSGY